MPSPTPNTPNIPNTSGIPGTPHTPHIHPVSRTSRKIDPRDVEHMRQNFQRSRRMRLAVGLASMMGLALLMTLSGCTQPASTYQLMHQVDRVLADQQQIMADQREADRHAYEQRTALILAGFEADLRQRHQSGELSEPWIREAVRMVSAAHQALAENYARNQIQREKQLQNLTLARNAQTRAIALLHRQDELWQPVIEWQNELEQNIQP